MSLIQTAQKLVSQQNQDKGKKKGNKVVNNSRQDLDASFVYHDKVKTAKSDEEAYRFRKISDSLHDEAFRKHAFEIGTRDNNKELIKLSQKKTKN